MTPGLLFTMCGVRDAVWEPLGQRLSCWARTAGTETIVFSPDGLAGPVVACCDIQSPRCPSVLVPEALIAAIGGTFLLKTGGTDYKTKVVPGAQVKIVLAAADVAPIVCPPLP